MGMLHSGFCICVDLERVMAASMGGWMDMVWAGWVENAELMALRLSRVMLDKGWDLGMMDWDLLLDGLNM